MADVQDINPPGTEQIYEKWHFSQATVCGDIVEVAGQVGMQPDGTVPEDICEQARIAYQNVAAVLEASGSSMDRVLHITQYLTDIRDSKTIESVFTEMFPNRYPARTVVQVVALVLPKLKIEVQVRAAKK